MLENLEVFPHYGFFFFSEDSLAYVTLPFFSKRKKKEE